MAAANWHRSTDGDLLRAAPRDPEAFAEFYARHEAIVAGYIARRTRDAELTADLTAETFATALLKAGRFRGDGGEPAIGWLLGIARHLLLMTWRSGRAESRARQRLGVERIVLTDASLERVEALGDDTLLRALDALPPAQRDAVRAHVLDERPYDDFDVPAATIRQRVSRGLARMRTTLEGRS